MIFDLLIELIIIFFFDHNKNFFFNIKKDKLLLVPGSVSVVGEGIVMEKNEGSNIFTPILSDHYPVKAEFKVI